MTERTKQEQSVIANLMAAGCDNEQIEQFMSLIEQGQEKEGLALLAKHRKHILDCYHAEQKKIDCPDYLVYQMRRK
jgi:hypothetical protein